MCTARGRSIVAGQLLSKRPSTRGLERRRRRNVRGSTKEMACRVDQTGLRHLFSAVPPQVLSGIEELILTTCLRNEPGTTRPKRWHAGGSDRA